MNVPTLTDAELAALDADGAWAHLADIQRFANRLEAYRARVLAVAEKLGATERAGRRRLSDALAWRSGIARSDARRAVHAARTAAAHPEVAEVFDRGDITQTQAAAIGGARVPEPVRRSLLARAATLTSDQTVELVAAAERAQLDPNEEFLHQRELRTAGRFRDRDGMWSFQVRLDPEAGARAEAVLDAHVERLWRQDKETGRTHQRTSPQRLADAFCAAVEGSAGDGRGGTAGGRTPQATINVTVPHVWLAGETDAAGVTTNGAILSAETLRRLACDAHLLPTVLGGRSEVLDVGRARRTATEPQRRGLEARDGGCFNCGAPPSRCHAHHVDHWSAERGRTDIERMALACHDCHILTHEGGFHVVRGPDGGWELVRPEAGPGRPADHPP